MGNPVPSLMGSVGIPGILRIPSSRWLNSACGDNWDYCPLSPRDVDPPGASQTFLFLCGWGFEEVCLGFKKGNFYLGFGSGDEQVLSHLEKGKLGILELWERGEKEGKGI